MSLQTIHHATVLNFHQPAGNLDDLLDHNPWEAKEILWALDRMPRALWGYEDIARVHLSLSGTFLETLINPGFQSRVYGIAQLGSVLWHLQNTRLFTILGTGYYHPVLPLIPSADWEEHLRRWQGIGDTLWPQRHFRGFWPPEMGFTMELIPLLTHLGYEYVIVDSENVKPIDPMDWHELRYRPHIAQYGGCEITVIVRDRDLSDAQESGMDPGWFIHEAHERTRSCDFPPLITTASDGDNGGWFRNVHPKGNYWFYFYRALCDRARAGDTWIRPVEIDQYLDEHGAHGRVDVETAAWNTGWHHGKGFVQWTGSQAQTEALERVAVTSEALHKARSKAWTETEDDLARTALDEAYWLLLRAQTSCNFYWGEAWVPRAHNDLDQAWNWIHRAGAGA